MEARTRSTSVHTAPRGRSKPSSIGGAPTLTGDPHVDWAVWRLSLLVAEIAQAKLHREQAAQDGLAMEQSGSPRSALEEPDDERDDAPPRCAGNYGDHEEVGAG